MSADSSPAFIWRAATLADGPAVLALMRAFYAEEHLPFAESTQGRALDMLLADPSLGNAFLCERADSAGSGASEVGHLILTRGHSLEFGGSFLLLDELYLAPEARGLGEGRRAIEFATAQARSLGAGALRLEVSHENRRARAMYRRAGFTVEKRDLMTLRLD